MLSAIRARGVEICELTLDVGLVHISAIHSETLEEHVMHAESYEISPQAAQQIQAGVLCVAPILAVGTNGVRALEDSALRAAEAVRTLWYVLAKPKRGVHYTWISFRVVNSLLTNFHLPKSTLLALVSAFCRS